MGEKGDRLREMASLVDEEEELENRQKEIKDELGFSKGWLYSHPLDSHENVVKNYAKAESITYTEANKRLEVIVKRYEIEGKDVPDIIKQMRRFRRTLKGDKKTYQMD